MLSSSNFLQNTVRSEYEMVLQRRIEKLGGDKADPGIVKLLNSLSGIDIETVQMAECAGTDNLISKNSHLDSQHQSSSLTPWIDVNTNSFLRGTEMAFSRQPGGTLVGDINQQRIVRIENNEKLCDAFFDVYLGTKKSYHKDGNDIACNYYYDNAICYFFF